MHNKNMQEKNQGKATVNFDIGRGRLSSNEEHILNRTSSYNSQDSNSTYLFPPCVWVNCVSLGGFGQS